MKRYVIHVSRKGAAVEVRVTADGAAVEFARGAPVRVFADPIPAIDAAVALIGQHQGYGDDELAAEFARDGHSLEVAADVSLQRIARVHLSILRGFALAGDPPPVAASDPDAVRERVVAEWERLVADEPDELTLARAHRATAAPGLARAVALVPNARAAEMLGAVLEVIAGRSLVHGWAAEVHCPVRLAAGPSANDEVSWLETHEAAAVLRRLEDEGAGYLRLEENRARLGQIDALKAFASAPSGGTALLPGRDGAARSLLSTAHASTAAAAVTLREPGLWLHGAEIVALFPATSRHDVRRHQCAELARPPALTVDVEWDGRAILLRHESTTLADVPSARLTALAVAYAALDGRSRGRPPTGELLAALSERAGRPGVYAGHGTRAQRLFDAPATAAHRMAVGAYLDHVLGRDALVAPLRELLARESPIPSVQAARASAAVRAAAARLHDRARRARTATADAERDAVIRELRGTIQRRFAAVAERVTARLGTIRQRSSDGPAVRELRFALDVVAVDPGLVRDVADGGRSVGAAADATIGAALRKVATRALDTTRCEVARLLSEADPLPEGRTAGRDAPRLASWSPPPMPSLAALLAALPARPPARVLAEHLAAARTEYARELEGWLARAVAQLAQAALDEARTAIERAEAAALVEVPPVSSSTQGSAEDSGRFAAVASALDALADQLSMVAP